MGDAFDELESQYQGGSLPSSTTASNFDPIDVLEAHYQASQAPTESYGSQLISSLFNTDLKTLGKDAYGGIVAPVVGLANSFGTASSEVNNPASDAPTLLKSLSQVPLVGETAATALEMGRNFYKDKSPTEAFYDTGKLVSGGIPIIGPYAYDKAQQYVNPDIIPATTPQQDATQIRQNTLGLAGLGLLSKVVGKGSETLQSSAESQVGDLVGYKPTAKSRVVAGLDAEGNVTYNPSQAVEQVSKQDLKLKDLQSSDFPSLITASDGPKNVALKLWQFKQEQGQAIGAIVDKSSQLENQLLSDPEIAPWEKASYLDSNEPHLSDAQDYIDKLKGSDPALGEKLQTKLDNVMEGWNSGSQTVADLKKIQEDFGDIHKKSFNKSSSLADVQEDTVNNLIYSDLAQTVSGRISTLDPALGDALKTANKNYSAAATFQDPAFNAARKGATGKLASDFSLHGSGGALGAAAVLAHSIPGAGPVIATIAALKAAKDVLPVQSMLVTKAAGGVTKGFSDVLSNPIANSVITNATVDKTKPTPLTKLMQEAVKPQPSQPTIGKLAKSVLSIPETASATQNDMSKISDGITEKTPVNDVISRIDSDPYFSTLFQIESKRNPNAVAKNPRTGELLSSAKGAFQLLDSTAKSFGVKDPFNIGENLIAADKLTDENRKRFGDNPALLYSAHYLGATVLDKVLKGDQLTDKQKAQVKYLNSQDGPLARFMAIYNSKINDSVLA